MNIAVIGTGTMGTRIVGLLKKKGYSVTAFDPVEAARANAARAGANVASSAAEAVSIAEIIFLSLPKPEHVRTTLTGSGGIVNAARPNSIFIDTSTVDPQTSVDVGVHATSVGCSYLDSPILGRPEGIGSWVMPVGGERRSFEAAEPILHVIAKHAFHVGPVGSGSKIKLINQLMFATINAVYCEIFALADAGGIGVDSFFDVLKDSGASTVSPLMLEIGRRIVSNDFEPDFSIDLLVKDVSLANDFIAQFGGSTTITGLTLPLARMATTAGLGKKDNAAFYQMFRDVFHGENP